MGARCEDVFRNAANPHRNIKESRAQIMVSEELGQNGGGGQPRVLLVDDDARLLDALRRGLSLSGFDITTAKDAGQALTCVESGWPGASLSAMWRSIRRLGRRTAVQSRYRRRRKSFGS